MTMTARQIIANYMIRRSDGDENFACCHRITETDADAIVARLKAAGFVITQEPSLESLPTQAEVDAVASVFAEVESDPTARGSAIIMTQKLRRALWSTRR